MYWVLNMLLDKSNLRIDIVLLLKIKYIGYGDVDLGDDFGNLEDEV